MNEQLTTRHQQALQIVLGAATLATAFFRNIDGLSIEQKGFQDLVSNADKDVETHIRHALEAAFPDDGIVGEEHGNKSSSSGYTWIIDPIDGTANFVRGNPGWAVVLACVFEGQSVLGIIRDDIADETFVAIRGEGATLNGKTLKASGSSALSDGSTGVGYSTRLPVEITLPLLSDLMQAGGVFYRSASGALMLAYVAAGRLIGYTEAHMFAWDCVAALLLIEEAGGRVAPFDMETMIKDGGPVIVGCPGVYDELLTISKAAYLL